MMQGGENEKDHRCADGEIGPRSADSARKTTRVSSQMAESRESLGGRSEADRLRKRSVLTERRAGEHDDIGLDGSQALIVEAVLAHVPDGEVLGDDIAARDEPARDFLRLRIRQI